MVLRRLEKQRKRGFEKAAMKYSSSFCHTKGDIGWVKVTFSF